MMKRDGKSAPRPARPAKAARPAEAAVDDPIQRAIGEKLRSMFDAVAEQPVPDRFTELLRRLEEQERQKK